MFDRTGPEFKAFWQWVEWYYGSTGQLPSFDRVDEWFCYWEDHQPVDTAAETAIRT